MNKVFLGIILAVCVLGMLLVMLNDRLGRKSAPRLAPPVAEAPAPPAPRTPEEIEANARALEIADAARALAGPEVSTRTEAQNELPPPVIETLQPQPAPLMESAAPQTPPAMPKTAAPSAVKPEPQSPPPNPIKSEPKQAPVTLKPDVKAMPEAAASVPEPKTASEPKMETAQPSTPPAGGRTVTRFVIYARDKGATVRIGGSGKMEYSSMTLENPERVVVDLPGSWKFPANPGIPKNELVSAVRVGQSGDKTRVVIDLKQKPRKVILAPFRNGDGVDVRVDK